MAKSWRVIKCEIWKQAYLSVGEGSELAQIIYDNWFSSLENNWLTSVNKLTHQMVRAPRLDTSAAAASQWPS